MRVYTRPFFKESLIISSAVAVGSFVPTLRFATLEIHKVCLRISNLDLCQNPSSSTLAEITSDSSNAKTPAFLPNGQKASVSNVDFFRRSITGKTQKEVAQKLKAVTISIDDGTYTTPSKMTVGQWLDIWTAEYLGAVKPRTVDSYKSNVKNHIKPGLGALKLDSLNAHMIQSFYNGLGEEKNSKAGSIPKNCKKYPRRTAQGFAAGRGQWVYPIQSCRCLHTSQNNKERNTAAE